MSSLNVDSWSGYFAPQPASAPAATPAIAETDAGAFDDQLQKARGNVEHRGESAGRASESAHGANGAETAAAENSQRGAEDHPTPTAEPDAAAASPDPKTEKKDKDKHPRTRESQTAATDAAGAAPTVVVPPQTPTEAPPKTTEDARTTAAALHVTVSPESGDGSKPTETSAPATEQRPAKQDPRPVVQAATPDRALNGIDVAGTTATEQAAPGDVRSSGPTEKADAVRAAEEAPVPPASRRASHAPASKTSSAVHAAGETADDAPAEGEASIGQEAVPGDGDPGAARVTRARDDADATTADHRSPDHGNHVEPADQGRPASEGPQPAAPGQKTQSPPSDQADRVRFVQRVARAFEAAADRDGPVRLRLHPPELGSLRVELTLRNGAMSARVEAETDAARNLLLDNLPALRERLADHNIRIERFDVDWLGQPSGGLPQQSAEQAPRQDRRGAPVQTPTSSQPAPDPSDRVRQAARPGGRSNFDVMI